MFFRSSVDWYQSYEKKRSADIDLLGFCYAQTGLPAHSVGKGDCNKFNVVIKVTIFNAKSTKIQL